MRGKEASLGSSTEDHRGEAASPHPREAIGDEQPPEGTATISQLYHLRLGRESEPTKTREGHAW